MSYRNDSFYNLKDNNGMSGPYMGANHASNARFVYPSDRIRFLGAAEQLVNKDANISGYKIQRGYIRGLQQPGVTGGSFQPLKCSFQFNPQQITQVVTMREDVYLPIMQDPVQFTQPFAAMTNFNFDLLFDRSREVEGAVSFTDEGGVYQDPSTGTKADRTSPFTAADRDNIDYKRDVRDIGAMADLQVLYSIIGQGFSKETLAFQASRLKQAGITQLNKDGGTDPSDPNATNAGNIDSRVAAYINDSNIGNSAFLIPNPVRVIFSSMFMVDGFITGTTVDFLKFSTKMVPLQIRVGLTMNAMYIGFAREKTFLTEQLDQQAADLKEQAAQDAAAGEELQKAAEVVLSQLEYACMHSGNNAYEEIYKYAFEDGQSKSDSGFGRTITVELKPKDTKDLPTAATFTSDHTISLKWWFTVWASPDQATAAKVRNAKGSGYDSSKVGAYTGDANSSSGWEDWKTRFLTPDVEYIGANEPRVSNSASGRYKHSTSDTIYTTARAKYYTTKFNIQVTVTTNSSGNAVEKNATGEIWQVLPGTTGGHSVLKLDWGSTGTRAVPGQPIRS